MSSLVVNQLVFGQVLVVVMLCAFVKCVVVVVLAERR